MSFNNFKKGDSIDFVFGPNYTFQGQGIVIDELIIGREKLLKVAEGFNLLEEFCITSFSELGEHEKVLGFRDILYVNISQVSKISRKHFVLTIKEKININGNRSLAVEYCDLENIVSRLESGEYYLQTMFETEDTDILEIPYSEEALNHFSSDPSGKKYVSIQENSNSSFEGADFYLYNVSKVSSSKSKNGNYIHTLKTEDGKTYFYSIPIQLQKEEGLFIDLKKHDITERPFEHIDEKSGVKRVLQLKWLIQKHK